MLFSLGATVITKGAARCVPPEEYILALTKHVNGDWGNVCQEDKEANNAALLNGDRLLSEYKTKSNITFWIITEYDRSVTTILLPNEY